MRNDHRLVHDHFIGVVQWHRKRWFKSNERLSCVVLQLSLCPGQSPVQWCSATEQPEMCHSELFSDSRGPEPRCFLDLSARLYSPSYAHTTVQHSSYKTTFSLALRWAPIG